MTFILHPTLAADSEWIHDLTLCQVRLSLNAAFPWLIMIPQCSSLIEIIDLSDAQQMQLMREINITSTIVKQHFQADKLNVANLGNIVAQLHIHVIARYRTDPAWPHPVWNSGITQTYLENEKAHHLSLLRAAFKEYS